MVMERNFLSKKVVWILAVSALLSGLTWGASAQAADKVVVIPLWKSGAPAPAGVTAPVAKTGQTTSYAPGDDGDLKKGAAVASGRFVDNNNGTVTDKQTGLIWLTEGQCTQFFSGDTSVGNKRPWDAAVDSANKLASGRCGLTDGSVAGDWRLPNVNELLSLIDSGNSNPALPTDCPLAASTVPSDYWSSTTYAGFPGYAWPVYFYSGYVDYDDKSSAYYVRAVRGGQ